MSKSLRIVLCIVFVLLLTLSVFTCCSSETDAQTSMYYVGIYSLVKDKQFSTGQIDSAEILLYDENHNLVETISFPGYDSDYDVKYLRRNEYAVFIITGASFDDEWGYVYYNAEYMDIFSGINQLDREYPSGAFKFSTLQ